MQATVAPTAERSRVEDVVIVDADIHVKDTPGALAPYCEMP